MSKMLPRMPRLKLRRKLTKPLIRQFKSNKILRMAQKKFKEMLREQLMT
jgi:hypothetical protein